jgi:hypothetical protein
MTELYCSLHSLQIALETPMVSSSLADEKCVRSLLPIHRRAIWVCDSSDCEQKDQ